MLTIACVTEPLAVLLRKLILSPAFISNGVPKTEKLDQLLASLVIS